LAVSRTQASTSGYADLVQRMASRHRLPDALRRADALPRRGLSHPAPLTHPRITTHLAADADDDGCSRQPVSRVGGQDASWHVTVPSATLLLLL
jgi:hypothetical protein